MAGFRGLGGARALGGLRLAAAGPALPRPGGLLLSQVPGGTETSDPGGPRLGPQAEGRAVGEDLGLKESPYRLLEGPLEVAVGACPGWAHLSWSLTLPSPPTLKGSLGLGACPARLRPPLLFAALQLSPRGRYDSFLPESRRQQLEEQGAPLRARVGGGLERRPKASQL